MLAIDRDVEVVAAVADCDCFGRCDREHPNVVVTDIRMPPMKTDEGIRLAGVLRERTPGSASSC